MQLFLKSRIWHLATLLLFVSAMACDASTSSTSTDDGDDTEEHIVPIPDTYEGVWPPVYFVALGLADEGLAADHGDYWIDLKIANPQGLKALGSWTLSASNRSYLNVQLTSSEITYDFQVGDILRVHGEDFEGESDRVKSDNNPDIWDIVSTDTYGPLIEQGMFLLETPVGSTTDQTLDTTETAETTEEVDEQEVKIIDAVVYDTAENNDLWFINASFDKIKEVVAQGQWPTRNRGDAIFFENLNDTWAELYNANSPGNGTGDWQVAFTTVEEYYAPAIGLTGEALRAALHDIIDDHNVVIYDVLTAAFIFTDADPEIPGNAIQFYTGKSTATAISREHVWAKSHGGFDSSRYPAYSDLHHMRPSKTSVNGDRWHLDFGEGGALVEDTDDCYIVENLSFEPRDEVKGDVARSLFYMAVRYNGDEDPPLDLKLVEAIPSLLNAEGEPDNYNHVSTPHMGKLSTLLQWHLQDPPDDFELHRNERIYGSYQHNRNPFVDHPEWVIAIWD